MKEISKEHQLRLMREEKYETKPVAQETKSVSNTTDNVAPETTIVAVIDGETITVADLNEMLDEAGTEIDRLEARIVLLEAELKVRKPKALSATERSRKWRRNKGG
jgi:hypothetical protein